MASCLGCLPYSYFHTTISYLSVQQYTTISYLSVQQSKLLPRGAVDGPMALLRVYVLTQSSKSGKVGFLIVLLIPKPNNHKILVLIKLVAEKFKNIHYIENLTWLLTLNELWKRDKNTRRAGHFSATSLVMPNGDSRDRFCYPTLTLMMDLNTAVKTTSCRRWYDVVPT